MPELHPDLSPEARRSLLVEGLEDFRAGRFFAAHEAWEEVWRSTAPEPRDLLQGLIQIAAGLHLERDLGRPEAARRVLARGRLRISPYLPRALGLDLLTLDQAVAEREAWLAAGRPAPEPKVPTLELVDPEALA